MLLLQYDVIDALVEHSMERNSAHSLWSLPSANCNDLILLECAAEYKFLYQIHFVIFYFFLVLFVL